MIPIYKELFFRRVFGAILVEGSLFRDFGGLGVKILNSYLRFSRDFGIRSHRPCQTRTLLPQL